MSARALALVRVALALAIWGSLAGPMRGIHALGDPLRLAVTAGFWLASPAMFLGWYSRASTALTGLSILATALLLRPPDALTTDPFWLGLAALGLAATPCGLRLSIDRLTHPSDAEAPAWAQWLLLGIVALVHLALAWIWRDQPVLSALIAGLGAALLVPAARPVALAVALPAHFGLFCASPSESFSTLILALGLAALPPGVVDSFLER